MQYADDSFDPKILSFDISDKTWITIPSDHQAFSLLLWYIVSNLASCKGGYEVEILPADPNDEESENPLNNLVFDRVRPTIGYGQYTFKTFDGEILHGLYQHLGQPVGTSCGVDVMENLVIFSSSSIESLCSFISKMISISETPQKGKFICYNWVVRRQYWREEARIDARPMDSVVLPSATKDRLIKDVERFLSPKSKNFYLRNGIPYRRSYLFYGVPGTGKTSMVQALAGHFRRNVCFLLPTHPEMTDDSLREAIQRIPKNSIVVFEDIDALFDSNRSSKLKSSSLTFSGLLNALDGIISTHGQIFILTTNLRENLDSALIRNGRVDLHFEFNYAIPEQIEQMWMNFYPEHVSLAKEFSDRLVKELQEKKLSITTSALQHFFINQMDSSVDEALSAIHTIVEDIVRNSSKSMLESAKNAAEGEKDDEEKDSEENNTNQLSESDMSTIVHLLGFLKHSRAPSP